MCCTLINTLVLSNTPWNTLLYYFLMMTDNLWSVENEILKKYIVFSAKAN